MPRNRKFRWFYKGFIINSPQNDCEISWMMPLWKIRKFETLVHQSFVFWDEYINSVHSKETAIAYIEERLPGYQIKAVKGDGMCILHSFREALDSIGIEVTLEEINSILKLELPTNKDYGNFTTSGVKISNELQLFLNSPMTYYNADTTDLFLFALVNFFDIIIVIFKSN